MADEPGVGSATRPAFAAVRAQDYSAADLGKDWAEGLMDASYRTTLSGARHTGFELKVTSRLPVARFVVTDKNAPMTEVVRVDGGSGTAKDNLTKQAGPPINAANYAATLAVDGESHLFVSIDCPAINAVPTAAGVYAGMVRDTAPTRNPIARVIVAWPG